MKNKKTKLNPRQELFCKIYTSAGEFFGNGTYAYLEAYGLDKNKKSDCASARANASRLLINDSILKKINELIEDVGFNDANMDKQLFFVCQQNSDLSAKVQALREYNKLKSRVKEKQEHVGEITLKWEK